MSQSKPANNNFHLETGSTFGKQTVSFYNQFGDLLMVKGQDGFSCVYELSKAKQNKAVSYKIKEDPIEDIIFPEGQQYFLLVGKKGMYLRDFQNRAIEDYTKWADAYFEPITRHFYRQTKKGFWVDMNNHLLPTPIFLTGDVLISLPGKISRQSYSFVGQEITTSKHFKLVQLGKVVYDQELEIQYYFDTKIAGLEEQMVSLGKSGFVNSVSLGLNRTAFIYEDSGEPFTCQQKTIRKYLGAFQGEQTNYHRFQSDNEEFIWNEKTGNFLCWHDEPVAVDFDKIISIGQQEFIQASLQGKTCFINLNTAELFTLKGHADQGPVVQIDLKPIKLQKKTYWNVATMRQHFVYCEEDQTRLEFPDGLVPEKLFDIPGFKRILGGLTIGDNSRIFYKKNNQLLKIGPDEIEISQVEYRTGQKLINATTALQQPIVLDARQGFESLTQAKSEEQTILEVLDKPHSIGQSNWQNARIQTLGGSAPLAINLNAPSLAACMLPKDLKSRPDGDESSIYQGSRITSMDFSEVVPIGKHRFFSATTLPFGQQPIAVLISEETGLPLQLEGGGYQYELVSHLDQEASTSYFGKHEMINVHTLTEDFKSSELLLSTQSLGSGILFRDAVLPPIKQMHIIDTKNVGVFQLFEIRSISPEKEYFVVENEPPYRLLVVKKGKKEIPQLIESTKEAIRQPEMFGTLKRWFLNDPGYLTPVD